MAVLSSLVPLGVRGVALHTGQWADGTPPLVSSPAWFQAAHRSAGRL